MKFNKSGVKGFMLGVLVAIILTTAIIPVAATTMKTITVATGGIKVYMDGNIKRLTDVNGKTVEPMIYDGTTYVPLRAAVNLLTDKEIEWDGKTQSIYIGEKPDEGKQSIPIDQLEIYSRAHNGCKVLTGESSYYNLFKEKHICFNMINSANWLKYKTDSKYSELHGYVVIDDREAYMAGDKARTAVEIYSIDKYGTETLIDSYEMKYGDEPIEVSTNISGCNFIKIETDYGKLFDITLTTA